MKIVKVRAKIFNFDILLFFAILTVLPFALMILTSLKNLDDIMANGPLALPAVWRFENYSKIWSVGNFMVYYKNSFIITSITALFTLLFSTLGAYSFAHMRFKFRNTLFTFILLGLLIPTEMVIIPLYHNLRSIGLLNTVWAVALPQVAFQVPFGTFLLRGFMKDIPASLLESARMDGSTELKNLAYIIVPLVKPAVISLLIYSTMWSWNNFFLPMIVMQEDSKFTVPVGLNMFKTQWTTDFPMISTAALIACVPIIIVYVVFQNKITQGMMVGAIKE